MVTPTERIENDRNANSAQAPNKEEEAEDLDAS
jgi:hypothetical protein